MCRIHPVQPDEAAAAIRLLRHKVREHFLGKSPKWFDELEKAFNNGNLAESFKIVDEQKTISTVMETEYVDLLTGLWRALCHLKYGEYDPEIGPPCKCEVQSAV